MARSVSISPVQTKFWDEIKTHPNIPYEPFGASACEDISSDYRRATSRSLNGEAGPIGRPFFACCAGRNVSGVHLPVPAPLPVRSQNCP